MDLYKNFAKDQVDGHTTIPVKLSAAARHAGSTQLPKGLALGKITASGLHREYLNASADGSEVCTGLLAQPIDVAGAADHVVAPMYVHGNVDEDSCTGIDAAAKADLAGRINFVAD